MCSQKCRFIAGVEYIAGRSSARGAIAYNEPMVIMGAGTGL